MPPPPLNGIIVGARQWTDLLHSVKIEAEVEAFEAGQFGRIGYEVDGKPLMRPYSFVNAPHERPHEFYYVLLEDGPITNRLVCAQKGDSILVSPKPNGFLVLSEVPNAEQLWMLSTGTAVGPFLSILKCDEVWNRFSRIVLAHGVRHSRELSYADDIKSLVEKRKERLNFVPFVSREDCPGAMRGRILAALQSGELAKRVGLEFSPSQSQFMLCGNPDMVKDTTAALKEMGFERNRRRTPGHITAENYW